MGLELWSDNKLTIKPSELEGFILNEFGIGCKVVVEENNHYIKLNNHFALFTLINKVRRKFDFEVYHKKNKNEFIIKINELQ